MANQPQSNVPSPPNNPPPTAAETLREHMGGRYAQRPRVSKHTAPQRPFDIGDPTKGDEWKWEASVAVHDALSPLLVLVLHSVPVDPPLAEYVEGLGGRVIPKGQHASFVIHLASTDTPTIRELAKMIRSVVMEKWRWLSEKFAAVLVQLANHLDQFKAPPTSSVVQGVLRAPSNAPAKPATTAPVRPGAGCSAD